MFGLGGFALEYERFFFDENQTAHRNQKYGKGKGNRHNSHKFERRNIEFGVEIEVLRIAERREHSAEVCRNILHDERENHVLFFLRICQNEIAERKKG